MDTKKSRNGQEKVQKSPTHQEKNQILLSCFEKYLKVYINPDKFGQGCSTQKSKKDPSLRQMQSQNMTLSYGNFMKKITLSPGNFLNFALNKFFIFIRPKTTLPYGILFENIYPYLRISASKQTLLNGPDAQKTTLVGGTGYPPSYSKCPPPGY